MSYIKYINDISLVSSRIEEILNDGYFDFSMEYLKSIHKYLFNGILLDNGMFRTYDVSKHEFTLNEKSVIYANHNTINTYLEYDFNSERKVNYNLLSEEEKVRHIADFTSRIWQTHPFSNGNTRTVLVFIQKYLRQYGIYLDNSLFKDNSKYFRGALVKSAYYNQEMGIHNDLEPLFEFFRMVMYDNDIILDEDKLYEDRLFKKRNEIELLDSKYINYLIDKFKKCYGIYNIEYNDRFKLLFSTWIDKMKRDINNFSLYLDYLDISICDRKICEVGHGKLDSLLYNTKHRGLVLSSYFNELCHEMGNTFFDGKLVFKGDVPLIVSNPLSKRVERMFFPEDFEINTFITLNPEKISDISSWPMLHNTNHSYIIGTYGSKHDKDINYKKAMIDKFIDKYADDTVIKSDTVDGTCLWVVASKKLLKKK